MKHATVEGLWFMYIANDLILEKSIYMLHKRVNCRFNAYFTFLVDTLTSYVECKCIMIRLDYTQQTKRFIVDLNSQLQNKAMKLKRIQKAYA